MAPHGLRMGRAWGAHGAARGCMETQGLACACMRACGMQPARALLRPHGAAWSRMGPHARAAAAPALCDVRVLAGLAFFEDVHVVGGHALLRDEHLLAAVDDEVAALGVVLQKRAKRR